MNFYAFVAGRYLFAKKSQNVINIITIVSIIGVAFGTAGLIIVLSVFNGFGNLVLSLYDDFDSDIKITATTDKTFDISKNQINLLQKIDGVNSVAFSLEENALLRYRDRQVIARIKGVDKNFISTTPLRNKIIDGEFLLQSGDTNYMVLGSGVAYYLGMNMDRIFSTIQVYMPKRGIEPSLDPFDAFNNEFILPSGVFSLQPDFDNKYVLVPLVFARKILEQPTAFSSIEIKLSNYMYAESVKSKILAMLGNKYSVKTREQQHDFLYKILTTEKFVAYFILTLILIIATFTIIGSLTMLIIEKKHDLMILKSMGATNQIIQKIFFIEGVFITMIGAISGLVLGFFTCYAQLKFGLITITNSENFLVESYPVAIKLSDFTITFFIVSTIGLAASWYATRNLLRANSLQLFQS